MFGNKSKRLVKSKNITPTTVQLKIQIHTEPPRKYIEYYQISKERILEKTIYNILSQ